MKLILFFILSLLTLSTDISGRIEGDYSFSVIESPYYIIDDLTFTSSSNVIIQAGVELIISQNAVINIEGRLLAIGEFGNEIIFKPQDIEWGGLKITSKEPVLLKYCIVKNGGSAENNNSLIYINSSSPSFEYCTFEEYNNDIVLIDKISEPDFGQGFRASEGFNTFINSNENFYINNRSAFKIYAKNNCWSREDIDQYIFDNQDIPNFGEVETSEISLKCPSGNLDTPQFIYEDTTFILLKDDFILWNEIELAEQYLLEYSANNFVQSDSAFLTTNLYQLPDYITNSELTFRVKALAGKKESLWSEILILTTLDTLIPNKISLNSIDTDNCSIDIEWNNDPLSESYQLQLSPSFNFENVILLDREVSSNTFSFQSNNLIKYYYRVRGINLNGVGEWSDVNEFNGPENYFIQEFNPVQNNIINYDGNIATEKYSEESNTLIINDQVINNIISNSLKVNKEDLKNPDKYNYLTNNNNRVQLNSFNVNLNESKINYEFDNIYDYAFTDLNNDNNFEFILNVFENDKKKIILKNKNKTTISEREIDIEANYLEPINDLNSILISGKNQIGTVLSLLYDPFTFTLDTLHSEIADNVDSKLIKFQNENYLSLLIDSSLYIYNINDRSLLISQEIEGLELEILDFNNNNYPDLFIKGFNTHWFEFYGNNLFEIDTLQGNYLYSYDENKDGIKDLIFTDRIIINNHCSQLENDNNINYTFDYNSDNVTLDLLNLPLSYREVEVKIENNNFGRSIRTLKDQVMINNIPSGIYDLTITPINQNGSYYESKEFTLLSRDQIFIDSRFENQETSNYSKLFLNSEIETGYDIIAGFYVSKDSLICGGWDFVQNIQNDGLKLFQNDQQQNKNGFQDNDVVRFYYLDQSQKTVRPVAVNEGDEFVFGKDRNINLLSDPKKYSIQLKKGWNWISFPVTPFEPNINKIFASEIILNEDYENLQSFKDEVKIGDAYLVKSDSEKMVEVDYTFMSNSTISVTPYDWENLPSSQYQNVKDNLLFLRTPNKILIEDEPSNLDPYESIRVISNKSFSLEIENTEFENVNTSIQSTFLKYANAYLIATNKSDDDHVRIEDQLGNVLNEVTFSGQYIYTIPGDDPYTPQIEGAKEGDKLELFFINSSGNKTNLDLNIYDLVADRYDNDLYFTHDGLFQVDLATSVEGENKSFVYINGKKVNYSRKIFVYDVMGRLVQTFDPVPNQYFNIDLKGLHFLADQDQNFVQKIIF